MAATMAELGFNIDSSPMRRASAELTRMSGAAGKAERSTRQLTTATDAARRAVTGLVAALSAREVIQYADTWQNVANQLRQVTSGTRELEAIQARLVNVAKDTRSNFDATANLYARLARSTTELGLSTEDLIGLTTTINQSFAVSGASASEAATAITQLSQGLAAGALRGDEFNSVSEQAPALMRAIADSLNMTIGELRAFAAEGGITAEIVVNALRGAAEEIDTNFNKTVATFGQNLEIARTNMLQFIGSSDGINSAVSGVGEAIVWASERLIDFGDILPAMASQWSVWAGDVRTTLNIVGEMFAASGNDIQGMWSDTVGFLGDAFLNFPANVRALIQIATVEVAAFVDKAGAYASAIAQYLDPRNWFDDDAQTAIRNQLSAAIDGANQARLDSISTILAERDAIVNVSADILEAQQLARESFDIQTQSLQTMMNTAKTGSEELEKLAKAVAKIRDEVDPLGAEFATLNRQINTLMEASAAGIISPEMRDKLIKGLVEAMAEAGEDSAEAFVNPWQTAADNVANSLQDAIASGDWDKIGDVIGNTLATSIAGIVNKTITDSLAKDLTANSSALAQIGGAFAGPIAGAVAGGAIQLAVSELSDYFSDDWDPTAARQAAQGTGTVLGSIDAKSESIAKAVDISAGASRELVGINRDMLRALQAVQLGIEGASARVARGQAGAQDGIGMPSVYSGAQALSLGLGGGFEFAADAYLDYLSFMFTGGLVDFGKLLGGKVKKRDEGIQIIGGYITDLIDETIVNAYATFRVKKHAFDDYDTKERFQRIGGDVEQQFSLVFESLLDSVVAGADVLGVDAMAALEGFRVQTQRISLEGLNAAAQQAELEAYFGTVFDQLAGAAIPFLDDFQRAGEGLGETLARVATQVQVTEQAVDMLGLRFSSLAGAELINASDRLIELNGGLDQFISNMQNFIGNFATEAQQFEINANALAQGMGDLPLPQTREGFWALMQAQDAATEEGAENIATLLRLQGVADAYYSAIEKAQESYYQTEIAGQRDRLSEAQRANRAVQSAMDAMLFQSSAVQEASRQSAIRTLEQIANAGRVTDIGQLQSALDAATQLDQGRYSTFADYAREYARTSGVIGRVGDVTQQAEDREARMLRSLENQLEAVKGLREDLKLSQLAIIKQTNKTAKTLERFEIDGIEVRS
jgi:tape measure domain-containing protein